MPGVVKCIQQRDLLQSVRSIHIIIIIGRVCARVYRRACVRVFVCYYAEGVHGACASSPLCATYEPPAVRVKGGARAGTKAVDGQAVAAVSTGSQRTICRRRRRLVFHTSPRRGRRDTVRAQRSNRAAQDCTPS